MTTKTTKKTTTNPASKSEQKPESKTAAKPEQNIPPKKEQKSAPNSEAKTEEKPESVSLEQALKEEGEGRTPEKLDKGPNKTERATEIMKEMWDDLLAGKVKRKDVIKRFIEEVRLTPKGAATYFGSIKKKLEAN
jgi:hypothetical protein